MNIKRKIGINIMSLYSKLFLGAFLAFFSTRIVLDNLGVDDYGIFNLIAGVIIALSFVNSSLMSSTQRFLSVAIGRKNKEEVKDIFRTSAFLHTMLAIAIIIVLEAISPLLFSGFLNIAADKIETARQLYHIMIFSTAITFWAIPYNAAINANEDMWFYAISSVIVESLKLIAAFSLIWLNSNLLIWYGTFMLLIIIIDVSIKLTFARRKYEEVKYKVFSKINRKLSKEMIGFVGWNTLGTIATTARNQGVAIVLNFFFGVRINAVYAITNQVNTVLGTFSRTMSTALTPQIMKSEGSGDRKRMIKLSCFTSKLSFYLSSLFAIPLLIEMPLVLDIWLKNVPEYTVIFCRLSMWVFLIMQLYPGIVRAIQAEGRIKHYQITISIILSSSLIVGSIVFKFFSIPYLIFIVLIFAQILTMVATLYYAYKNIGLNIISYLKDIVLKPLAVISVSILATYLMSTTQLNPYLRLALIIVVSGMIQSILSYIIVLDKSEKKIVSELVIKIKRKIKP